MAAFVGERTREYGIRMALGATREQVSALVLRQACMPIAAGAIAGLLLSAWASRLAASLLFDVTPFDPVSFAAASLIVIACGVGATLLPAQRAERVDPVVVLKAE
jgi:putative ABC transport system permease protein